MDDPIDRAARRYWPTILILAIGCLAVGGCKYVNSPPDDPPVVDVSALEAGQMPSAGWVRLQGYASAGVSARANMGRGGTFVPVVSAGLPPGGVSAYVKARDREAYSAAGVFEGTASLDDLPADVRTEFSKKGFDPAPHYIVIDVDQRPPPMRKFAKLLMAGGVLLLLICLPFVIGAMTGNRRGRPAERD